jgi:hypothetical protein
LSRATRAAKVRQRPDAGPGAWSDRWPETQTENPMYIGGALGTILVILLIVYLIRRV